MKRPVTGLLILLTATLLGLTSPAYAKAKSQTDKPTSKASPSPKAESKDIKQLKVLTWNIWGRLNLSPRYKIKDKTARTRMIEILKSTQADIIVMIETYGSAQTIAKALGYHYYTPSKDANLCIFSRYPLTDVGTPKGLSSFSFIKAKAHISDKLKVNVYGIWLTSSGRHIVKVKDTTINDHDFAKADDVRHRQLMGLLKHKTFLNDLKKVDREPMVMAGDFNCVSHLDYTKQTQKDKLNFGRILQIKASLAMAKHKFIDSYRQAHPKITKQTLGYTWTTVGQGYAYESGKGFVKVKGPHKYDPYRELFARIDYVYHRGERLKLSDSQVIRYYKNVKTRSFVEFPSDHAGVLSIYQTK